MNASTRTTVRTTWVALRAMAVFTVLLGVGYTLLVTGIGQLLLPAQANGSVVTDANGEPIGSSLIGQPFVDDEGEPLPEYFQPRPSAAGDGYDGGASAGSNSGPENETLIATIAQLRAEIAEFNGVDPADIPVDAVTASGSGLDPHISPEYAFLQVARVAEARDLPVDVVWALVEAHVQQPALGFLGQASVNVLELNQALDELEG